MLKLRELTDKFLHRKEKKQPENLPTQEVAAVSPELTVDQLAQDIVLGMVEEVLEKMQLSEEEKQKILSESAQKVKNIKVFRFNELLPYLNQNENYQQLGKAQQFKDIFKMGLLYLSNLGLCIKLKDSSNPEDQSVAIMVNELMTKLMLFSLNSSSFLTFTMAHEM